MADAPVVLDSRIAGFYGWSLQARHEALAKLTGLSLEALAPNALPLNLADKLIENVVGVLGLPVGLGLNFRLNGQDLLVPMAIEEPSVVAAFSHASKLARAGGGFTGSADPSHMIGQIQCCPRDATECEAAESRLRQGISEIEAVARHAALPMAVRGGGLVRVELRRLEDAEGPPMLVLHLVVDVLDAMGANLVNHVAESVAPTVERMAQVPVHLRILSNLAVHRLARAQVAIPVQTVGGQEVAERIAQADRFARLDPFRAATHNKGIFNGIDSVALATGNDWRGIEAGAHAYAAKDGQYRGLTRWKVQDGALHGAIELPMAVGTVGGTTRSHPTVALLRQILGVEDARSLAIVFAAVGLAQNLGALRALATEGIQRGHMTLHARQLALAAGAQASEVDQVVALALQSGRVSAEIVARALGELRGL